MRVDGEVVASIAASAPHHPCHRSDKSGPQHPRTWQEEGEEGGFIAGPLGLGCAPASPAAASAGDPGRQGRRLQDIGTSVEDCNMQSEGHSMHNMYSRSNDVRSKDCLCLDMRFARLAGPCC